MSKSKLLLTLRGKKTPTLVENLDDFGPKGTRVEKNPYDKPARASFKAIPEKIDTSKEGIAALVRKFGPRDAKRILDMNAAAKNPYKHLIKKGAAVATKTDPGKWEQAKRDAKARMGGKHSARAMQLATQLYKKRGGGYSGSKPTSKSNSLKKWTKQKWKWSGGDKKGQGGKGVYLPSKKVDRLKSTRAGRKALSVASRKKAKATREGRQYSSHGLAAGTSLRKQSMNQSVDSLARHILRSTERVSSTLDKTASITKLAKLEAFIRNRIGRDAVKMLKAGVPVKQVAKKNPELKAFMDESPSVKNRVKSYSFGRRAAGAKSQADKALKAYPKRKDFEDRTLFNNYLFKDADHERFVRKGRKYNRKLVRDKMVFPPVTRKEYDQYKNRRVDLDRPATDDELREAGLGKYVKEPNIMDKMRNLFRLNK